MPLRDERPTSTIFYQPSSQPLFPAGQAAADKLIAAATAFIPDGRLSLFETFTIPDADLAMMLQRLIANGHQVPARLRGFTEAQWQRPSIRAFVNRPRPPYVPY